MSFEHFLEKGEIMFGKSTWEVIVMILLVQAPFVPPLVNTVKRMIKSLPVLNNAPNYVKKHIIGYITYLFSAFADNYVATKV
jgi:hypothetical protein